MQKFYNLPFSMDIHFAYRDQPFNSEDLDYNKTTTAIENAETNF